MNTESIDTPLKFLRYVNKFPMNELGKKLQDKTKAATGLPIVSSIALLGMAEHIGAIKLADLSEICGYTMNQSTMNGLLDRKMISKIIGTDYHAYTITPKGIDAALEAETNLKRLIAKLTRQ